MFNMILLKIDNPHVLVWLMSGKTGTMTSNVITKIVLVIFPLGILKNYFLKVTQGGHGWNRDDRTFSF